MGGTGSGESRASDEPSCPGKRHQNIRTCLSGEVESSSSPIRQQAPDVKYPEKVERQPDPDVRYPDEVERLPDPDVRYPDEVERRPDIIAAVRHPGGMSENFRLDGMSAKKNSEYDIPGWNERCHVSQGRGSHATLFREDPTLLTFYFYVSLDQRPITTQLCFNSVTIFKLQDSQSRVIWLDLC